MTTRWSTNITPAERAARIVIGGLGAVTGIVLLTGAISALAVVLELLLVVAGVISFVSNLAASALFISDPTTQVNPDGSIKQVFPP